MRNLGVPPTVNQLDTQYTTDFLKTVAERCSLYTGTVNPTVSQIPNKQWVLFKNTTNGEVRLWLNDNGVLKNVLLSTNTVAPTFSANATAAQVFSSGVFTKTVFDTVEFDVGGYYSTINNRYTPLVPGYYQVNATVSLPQALLAEIWKNGVLARRGAQFLTGVNAAAVSCVLPLNGTTDFLECYSFQASGANQTTNAASGAVLTNFNACFLRPL